jgi:hypothetical protein
VRVVCSVAVLVDDQRTVEKLRFEEQNQRSVHTPALG